MSRRVVVVGAGIAGLTTAYRLVSGPADPLDVTVLEAEPDPGGKVTTVEVGGLRIDAGPDSFVARKPWAVELCRELDLEGELIQPGTSGAFVWTDRGLEPFPRTALGVPAYVDELARWPGLSRKGRARALADLVKKPATGDRDESIGALVRRRLGDEAAEMLVGPVLGGLFAGDADRLSVAGTFPELVSWERGHGSLIRGARAALRAVAEAGAGPMFISLEGGPARLIDALAERLGKDRLASGTAATALVAEGTGFVVRAEDLEFSADVVVLATPAFVSAELIEPLAPDAGRELRAIPYASTGVVMLVYPEGTNTALPEATGFVVPRGKASMTACTFISRKWPRSEFGGRAVVRCFVGGVGAEDVLDWPDEDIVEAVSRHLAAVVALPRWPEHARVVRLIRSMPQYEVGHVERLAAIEGALPPGIFVTGSAYRGIGVADCIRDAGEIASRVRTHLGRHASGERQESATWTS